MSVSLFRCKVTKLKLYRLFSLSRNENIKLCSGYSEEIIMLKEISEEDTSPSFKSLRFPNPMPDNRQNVLQIYRAQMDSPLRVDLHGPPI